MTTNTRQARRRQSRTVRTFDDLRNYVEQHERDALDMNEKPALRACQAIGLSAPPKSAARP